MINTFFTKLFAPTTKAVVNAQDINDGEQVAAATDQILSNVNHHLSVRIERLKLDAHNYEIGWRRTLDLDKAISLYREGAELGGKYAIFKLAGFYADGTIQPVNLELAALWYKKGMRLHPKESIFPSKLADIQAKIR